VPNTQKILVIGLGQIGYHNAEYLQSLGIEVDGYDVNKTALDLAIKNKVITNVAKDFRNYDYYLVCVSTHDALDISRPNFDALFNIARKLSKAAKNDSIILIESTITRGISDKVKEIVGDKIHVAHVPHRFYLREKREHGVNQLRVVGGCEPCCLAKAVDFYGNILKIPLHEVSHVNIAELSKIVENSFRFIEIAFAEELKMFCDKSAIDFNELRNAVNTKWNIKILEARDGVGGHCLPKDSQMFENLLKDKFDSTLLNFAKEIDQRYLIHLRQKIGLTEVYRSEPKLGAQKG
jgi:UDP-N-acetyl-D-mannosaminuronic acid dehydrogenase